MSSKRKASHAGSWYSGKGDILSYQLEGWLSAANDAVHAPARAIIAPHAGYSYSGSCAAYAYKQIDPSKVKRIFILGPSHHVYLPDCALSSQTHYETPLYDLEIDLEVCRELESTGKFSRMNKKVDEDEHSIEMHLPYIAKVMQSQRGHFKVVPILVGALKPEKESEYGQILTKYLLDQDNLFIVSSDFCHWGRRFRYTYYNKEHGPVYASIEALDKQGMSKIESIDTVGFTKYLTDYNNTICGRHPITILLHTIENSKSINSDLKFHFRFLKYAQSNRCKDDSDSSVSYASGVLLIT